MKWSWLIIFIAGCGSPYAGYDEVDQDVHLRLIELGDGDHAATAGDSVWIHLEIRASGSAHAAMFTSEDRFAFEELAASGFRAPVQRMHAGDRAHLIMRSHRLPRRLIVAEPLRALADTCMVHVRFDLKEVRRPSDRRSPEGPGAELVIAGRKAIADYLGRSPHAWHRWGNSMLHYRIERNDPGAVHPQAGDGVLITYEGRRLSDSVVIDDPMGAAQEGLTFNFGDKDQVIEGLEVAVSLLHEGATGHFVIPGEMGFSERGVPGLVGSFEPLLYRVQLVKLDARNDPLTKEPDP